jgi:hypothetical protein
MGALEVSTGVADPEDFRAVVVEGLEDFFGAAVTAGGVAAGAGAVAAGLVGAK